MPTRRRKEKRVGERASAWEREREPFGSSVYMFSPPPGPALCKLGQPGVFVRPEVLTPVFGLRTFLCSVFAGFSLPCLLATAILDSFSLFYLPNRWNLRLLHWQVGSVPLRHQGSPLGECIGPAI